MSLISTLYRNKKNSPRRNAVLQSALQPLEQRMLLSTVSIASTTANEGSPLNFVVSLDSAASTPITVNYATANKTAKSGVNYAGTKGTLSFEPGQTSQTLSINTIDDNTYETAPLTMTVKLSKPTKGVKTSPSQATGTIDNIDAAPTFSVANATTPFFSKGSKTMTFTITENTKSTSSISVPYSTVPLTAAAGTDYTTKSGVAKFSGKKTTFSVPVKIRPHTTLANDLDFELALSGPSSAFGVGTIQGQNPGTTTGSTASIATTASTTAGSPATITISLDQPAADPVTVDYSTSGGTAGVSYTPTTNGSITIPVGTLSQTISIPTSANSDSGTFDVAITGATNAAVSSSASTSVVTVAGTSAALPIITINNPTVDEATSGTQPTVDFTVTLSAPSSQDVTLTYSTADDSAISGTNYTGVTNQTLTIPAGATTAQIPITILGDVTGSADFFLNLSNPTNATLATTTATATITNPASTLPTLSIADQTVQEATSGTTNAVFTVTLSAAASQNVTVNYTTANGTAVAPTNYTTTTGTLTFTPGVTTQQITVPIIGGIANTGTFTVNLSDASNAAISVASATGTITNAAVGTPTVSIGNVSQDEGTGANSTFVFPVTLSAASASTVTVDYATSDGPGANPATGVPLGSTNSNGDYYSASGTLTFPAGTTTENIDITVIGDTTVEPDETFSVTLSQPSNANLGQAVGTGTILNDDTSNPTIPVISLNDENVTQVQGGTNASFVVSLTSAASQPVTIDYSTTDGTAVAGTNYTAETNQVLTIPTGATSETINIPILYDSSMIGSQKSFTLTLSSPSSNVTLSPTNASATGTISSVQFVNANTGFAGNNNGLVFTTFNYSITNSQTSPVLDATLEFFFSQQGANLSNVTPFQTSDIGSIAANATVNGSVTLSNPPTLQTGYVYTAELVVNGQVVDSAMSVTVI